MIKIIIIYVLYIYGLFVSTHLTGSGSDLKRPTDGATVSFH